MPMSTSWTLGSIMHKHGFLSNYFLISGTFVLHFELVEFNTISDTLHLIILIIIFHPFIPSV